MNSSRLPGSRAALCCFVAAPPPSGPVSLKAVLKRTTQICDKPWHPERSFLTTSGFFDQCACFYILARKLCTGPKSPWRTLSGCHGLTRVNPIFRTVIEAILQGDWAPSRHGLLGRLVLVALAGSGPRSNLLAGPDPGPMYVRHHSPHGSEPPSSEKVQG